MHLQRDEVPQSTVQRLLLSCVVLKWLLTLGWSSKALIPPRNTELFFVLGKLQDY